LSILKDIIEIDEVIKNTEEITKNNLINNLNIKNLTEMIIIQIKPLSKTKNIPLEILKTYIKSYISEEINKI
jgi:hypothetical protein